MSQSIFELVNDLPTNNLTVKSLRALDFVVPGEWDNLVGFENTITTITGETDQDMIQAIGDRAVYLFNDESQGYQTAYWLYKTVDSASSAMGTAALANKVGEKIPLLGFLSNITPKADRLQSIDLAVKSVVELVAFCQINGLPGDSIGDFLAALGDYGGESLMRMAALICFDGLIPLGPDFLIKGLDIVENLAPQDLENNETFSRVSPYIPGGDSAGKLGFIGESFGSMKGWMSNFVSDRSITPESVIEHLRDVLEFSDDKLDYLAAFLDVSTDYYRHTGVQTLAHRLIERAVAEI